MFHTLILLPYIEKRTSIYLTSKLVFSSNKMDKKIKSRFVLEGGRFADSSQSGCGDRFYAASEGVFQSEKNVIKRLYCQHVREYILTDVVHRSQQFDENFSKLSKHRAAFYYFWQCQTPIFKQYDDVTIWCQWPFGRREVDMITPDVDNPSLNY